MWTTLILLYVDRLATLILLDVNSCGDFRLKSAARHALTFDSRGPSEILAIP